MLVQCDYCDTAYYSDEKSEQKRHAVICKRFHDAETKFGIAVRPSKARNEAKLIAKAQMADKTQSQKTRYSAAIELLSVYFEHSLDLAIREDYWKQHPKFDQYVAMLPNLSETIPPALQSELRRSFGTQKGQIHGDSVLWHPPNSNRRTVQKSSKKAG